MLTALVVDDEENCRITLVTFLQKYCPTITVVAQASSVAEAVEAFGEFNPQVIFLDIEMNDGTGFDVIEQLQGAKFEVIFVTAYNQYAIQAFRYSAIDYLLKPVNPEELVQSVTKLADEGRIDQIEKKLEALLMNRKSVSKIAIPSMEGIRLEKAENINYCESDNFYTHIHLNTGEKLTVSKTLKEYDTLLSDQGFFRIHQKYLVRVSEIKSYSKADGGYITLNDGTDLTVSRRKKDELLALITA